LIIGRNYGLHEICLLLAAGFGRRDTNYMSVARLRGERFYIILSPASNWATDGAVPTFVEPTARLRGGGGGRYCSFTAAAQELNVTQTAVSRMVRLLEQRLGFLLFRRHANALELTAQGQALLSGLTDPFDSIARLAEQVAAMRAGLVLTVGIALRDWVHGESERQRQVEAELLYRPPRWPPQEHGQEVR
jgi:DNA-binding MarR family transcriptional regulator